MASKLPVKTREMHSHSLDSTMWNDFEFRDDDIIISTWAKSGTTWVQQIVSQLLFNGAEDLEVAEMSPWIDLRIPPKEVKMPMVAAQEGRRFLKTHLPTDALVFSEKAKYLYIGRDGRDVVWSLHNHHSRANQSWYDALNLTPGLVGPPIPPAKEDIVEYFRDWLNGNGDPWWPFWENVRTWWEIRDLPNVHMLHFENLKKDMPGEICKIAAYLEIPIDESKWDDILLHCSFDYMKENATKSTPLGGVFWDEGAKVFVHKGVNGRWRDVLPAADIAKYEQTAVDELGDDCAHWLATGQM